MPYVIAHGALPDGEAVKSYRPRVAFPIGGGLDRSAGKFAVSREVHRDLVNLLPMEGRAQLRPGLELVLDQLVTDTAAVMDRIVGGCAIQVESANIVVGYDESERELHIFRVGTDGSAATHLGLWHTLPAGTATPPRVIAVEFQDRVFLAHDERSPTRRAATYVWDPYSATLGPLEADWGETDDEDEPVLTTLRFRGVTVHLEYLVGWGFGTALADAPDVIRTSLPGLAVDPADGTAAFDIQHSARVGNPGDPVTLCSPVANGLLVLKSSRAYPFVGASPLNFGVGPATEHRFGVPYAHLGVHYNGGLYLWTLEGPRVTTGGPLQDLALPLDLAGPSPEDLAAEGALDEAFAVYVPEHRILAWVFGQRVYALSVRDPNAGLRWSYWELGVTAEFGWPAVRSEATEGASPGTPVWTGETPGPDRVDVDVEHDGHLGDEYLELWLQGSGDDWDLATVVRASIGDEQVPPVAATGLDDGRDYEGALRYRRGAGSYAEDYQDPDPSNWPAISRGSFTTEVAGDASVEAAWDRTAADAEEVTLSFIDFSATAPITVERKLATEDDTEYAMLTTPDPLPAETAEYVDDTIDGEVYYDYRVTEILEDTTRVHVVRRWSGPDAPVGIEQDMGAGVSDDNWYTYRLTWEVGYVGSVTIIEDDYYCDDTFQRRALTAVDATIATATVEKVSGEADTGENGLPAVFEVRVWHRTTSFGVEDWSPMRTPGVSVRIAMDETEHNSCGGSGGGGPSEGGPTTPVET